jgi:hypothetical protein
VLERTVERCAREIAEGEIRHSDHSVRGVRVGVRDRRLLSAARALL